MPPRKKARTHALEEKPTQVMPIAETSSPTSSPLFFQNQARAERRLRRGHVREAQTEVAISSSIVPIKKAPLEIEQAQEKIAAIKTNLQKRKSEIEQQILELVSERSGKINSELAKLDFTIWDLIGRWKLLCNQLDSWDKRTGMIFEHQQIIRDIVTANGMVSWYRPINLEAESWLLKGAQGKALLTKGKSSGFDYIAGLIPVDVRLSKLMRAPTLCNPHDIAYYQSNMDFVMDMYDTQKVSKAQIELAYHDRGMVMKIELARIAVSALETSVNQQITFDRLAQYREYIDAANELPKQIAANHISTRVVKNILYIILLIGKHKPKIKLEKKRRPIGLMSYFKTVNPFF